MDNLYDLICPLAQKTICLTYRGVVYSKKNSKSIITNRRTGKPQIVSNQRAKAMEADMVNQFQEQALIQGWETGKGCIYCVAIGIYAKDYTRRDLDNQATSILDGLVAAGVIPDDSTKYVRSLLIDFLGVDKNDPRAKITILEMLP